MECRFCDLETKETHRIVERLEHCLVIFSNPRLMPGHLLVVPKRHAVHLSDLNDSEQKELFDTAIQYQEKILNNIASGCDLKQHNRPFLPENDLKVDHVHVHLQPREFEDELYTKSQIYDREIFKPLEQEEIEKILPLLGK
jgi:diadenosine tetraphosphate (Ap4A) HIT family hydrolase